MSTPSPQITHEEGVWVLRIEGVNGKTQEYRCASEGQARQLAQVLAGPKQAAAGGR